ncbi:hypothetical protein BHE74_00017820 [Ensete ventricosum]|nr:hypothetical protein GW17_00016406 [Ensete ventricosum]RWW74247.1 hypothetical protein BHE74_00017820 [Ensete ventricosum]
MSERGVCKNLEFLEECRAEAHLRTLAYKKAEISNLTHTRGKLALSWEGSYRVIGTIRDGTYKVATKDGIPLPRTWHISKLRKFYI